MRVNVVFLGPSRDWAGAENESLELTDGIRADGLMDLLADRFARLAAGRASLRIAVNERFVLGEEILQDGDEVLIVPPVSGG